MQATQDRSLVIDDERSNSGTVLVAAGAVFALLAWPALGRSIYVSSDLWDYFLPLRSSHASALKAGHDFAWFPGIFTGYYLHGDGAASLFHPFNLAGYGWLPLDIAFNLELLRSYPLIFAGTFALLRRWDLRLDAALFGALVFAFSGFNLLHYMHLNAVATVAHIPWLLWATDLSMRAETERVAALARLGVALMIGSALLHGYPQYMLYAALAQAGYVVLLLLERADWGRLWRLVALSLCGVAAGALQLLPTISALRESFRAEGTQSLVYSFSLEPINLLQLVSPYLFADRVVGGNPHEFGLYAGAAMPALCLWVLKRQGQLGTARRLALGAAVMGATSLLLALGEYGFLYTLQVRVPFLDMFRAPCRYIVLVHFCLSILAAIAFDDLVKRGREKSMSWRSLSLFALPPVLALVSILLTLVWQQSGDEPRTVLNSSVPLQAGIALVLASTALVLSMARGQRFAAIGLIALVALDLGVYGLSYIQRVPPAQIDSMIASVDRPPAPAGARVRSSRNFVSLVQLRNVGGYAAMRPRRELGMGLWHVDRLDESRLAALRVAGVSWFRVPAWDRRDGLPNEWIELDDPLPRARMVPQARVSRNVWRDLALVDVRQTALVRAPLDLPGDLPGSAMIRRDQPGSIHVDTQASTRQLLVVSESHHRGWRASIDGRPAELIEAYADFIGCVVEAGEHRVELEFDPPSLRNGIRVSAAGVFSAIGLTGLAMIFGARRS